MTLRPSQTLNKGLLSTTSRFVGEYEDKDHGILLTHAWITRSRVATSTFFEEGPTSRSAFMLVFETDPVQPKAGQSWPDWSGIPILFSSYLSVLFGKRFDSLGLVETHGLFNFPSLDTLPTLCNHTLPYNSHKPRVDFPVPLNLCEVSRIKSLLIAGHPQPFIRVFQGAAKFYSQALQVFEQDPEVAYLHLVTAIEILSNLITPVADEFYDAKTKNYFLKIEKEVRDGQLVSKHFRGKLLLIKKRFVSTVTKLVDEDFFSRTESLEVFAKLKSGLSFAKTVAAAYDLRSKYVHTGAPFGSWISRSMGSMNPEVQVGRPNVDDKDYAKTLEKAPTFVGLERIVRYCLLKSAQNHNFYVEPDEQVKTG